MPRSCSPSLSQALAIELTRSGQSWREVDPFLDAIGELGELKEQVLGLAHFEVAAARDRRACVDQVGRLEQPCAVLTLVAARVRVAAMRTGADDVAVGQEAAVIDRINLRQRPLLDEAGVVEAVVEMVGQLVVLRRRAAAEIIEAEREITVDLRLDLVLLPAIVSDRQPGLMRGDLGWCAMLIGGADKQHLVARGAHETRIHIGAQHRADQVAEMLDAVDVGQRRGDENFGHRAELIPFEASRLFFSSPPRKRGPRPTAPSLAP